MKKWFSIIGMLLVLLFISSAPTVTETDVGKPDGIAMFENFEDAEVLTVEARVKALERQVCPNVDISQNLISTYRKSVDVPLYATLELRDNRPGEVVQSATNRNYRTNATEMHTQMIMSETGRTHSNIGKYLTLSSNIMFVPLSDNLNKNNFVAGRTLKEPYRKALRLTIV